MGYLFLQILFCLLVAFALGALIGWLARGARAADCVETEQQRDAARARVAELQRELAAARGASGTASAAAAHVSDAVVIDDAPEASGAMGAAGGAAGSAAGLFGAPASAPVDDLKKISGVGPVIETQLAGIGITTYRQIADLTADDVARVNDAIEVFQGRIEREDWITQAARLHREKYDEAP